MNSKRKSKNYSLDSKIIVPAFRESEGFYATKRGSYQMSQVKSKDTKAEILLRKELWKLGFRYRINVRSLPGKPDLVFRKQKLVIFVDGDFWHGYNWEQRKLKIKTNLAYWIPKIERNMQRDREITKQLIQNNWNVLRLWEHELKKDLASCLKKVVTALSHKNAIITI